MTLFRTTQEQFEQVKPMLQEMRQAGLSEKFVNAIAELAQHDQGIYELVTLWKQAYDNNDIEESAETITTLATFANESP